MKVCQTSGWLSGWRSSARGALQAAALPALFLAVLAGGARAAKPEKVDQLSPQGYVNDFAGVIDAASKQTLTELCQEVDSKAGAQIAVVTIKSLEGDSVDDFTINLAEKWGVGPKQKDRGVMILLAVEDHQYRTEVGYGLEPILTDGEVGGFGRQMVPLLRQNQYGPALVQITSQIANVIAQDKGVTLSQPAAAAPAAPANEPDEQGPFGIPPIFLFWLVILLFFGGWRLITWLLIWMGLMRPRSPNRRTWMGGGPMIGGWGGGGFGGGGGGGGGFGGFGGGGFGGGGASGGW